MDLKWSRESAGSEGSVGWGRNLLEEEERGGERQKNDWPGLIFHGLFGGCAANLESYSNFLSVSGLFRNGHEHR
jgi:hypothetical protein